MQGKLLVDAENFMARLEEDILHARGTVMVQAMTFEGDNAGKRLIEAMISSQAKERFLLIDSYTKAVINDHFVIGPEYLRSSSFREEVKKTKQIIQEGLKSGIQIKFTNPLGFLGYKYPLRNHKKMISIDGMVSYIGGINFSDHNFAWHDAMIRVEDNRLSQVIEEDFRMTLSGMNQSRKVELAEGALYFLNGSRSKSLYEDLFSHLSEARKTIDIISPYVSDPLLSHLKNKVGRRVQIRIISPRENNKSIFKKYLNNELQKGYFELLHYQKGMSHLKAILIDGETLIMGSSNFDFVSYHFEQEVVLVSKDKTMLREFEEKVLNVDLSLSKRVTPDGLSSSKSVGVLVDVLHKVSYWAGTSFLKPK